MVARRQGVHGVHCGCPYLRRFVKVPVRFVEAEDERDFAEAQALRVERTSRLICSIGILFVAVLLLIAPSEWPTSLQDRGRCIRITVWLSGFLTLFTAFLPLRRFPEIGAIGGSLLSVALILGGSKYRCSFFAGEINNTWGITDSEFTSDSLEIASLAIVISGFYAGLPLRCSRSWVMILLIPAVYLALTLPLPEDHLPYSRRILIAVRLMIASLCGFLGRSSIEITDRVRFLRVRSIGQELAAERVLRARAEHEAEKASPGQAVPRSDELLSLASHATGRSSGATSTSSFLFKFRVSHREITQPSTVRKQLLSLSILGKQERWLIDEEMVDFGAGKVLGQGGFGMVFAGLMAGTEVAIKMPKGELHPGALSSVANELRVLRHLSHPNIVAFYGA
ncbi:unnamed protein product [Polarella glacialis]|uniref:Protein kinase domain-containing protein n=1 Tax=Polarella glacialis TaxID=89957 RepID=A0A813HT37_POLGL|nr:unnamed protein product [Polarella glacialis]